MRKIALGVVAGLLVSAGGAGATAQAKTERYCGSQTTAINVDCTTALKVRQYWAVGHETWSGYSYRIAGRMWKCSIKRGPMYFTDFKSGNSIVHIESLPYG